MKISGFQDRRFDPRIHTGSPVLLQFGRNDSEEAGASIVNISERGMSVHSHCPLRLGMEVKVVLESAPDDANVYFVVWVRDAESPRHGYDIGLERKP